MTALVRVALVLCLLTATGARAGAGEREEYIPCSPLVDSEAVLRGQAAADGSSSDKDEAFARWLSNRGSGACGYREEDIRRAYPELREADAQAYLCMNGGSTTIAYASPADEPQRVTVKRITCRSKQRSLVCGGVQETLAWYVDDPRHFFALEDGTPFAEAREILALFAARKFAGADEGPEKADYGVADVAAIAREGDAIRLQLGHDIRCGCVSTVTVAREGDGDAARLRIVKALTGQCI